MEKDTIDYSQELILIVDDDAHLREMLGDFLATLNISSESASNGSEALKILDEKEYTFVLTDMKMQGMDGLKLIEKMHNGLPNISIIAMTPVDTADTKNRTGSSAVFHKAIGWQYPNRSPV